MSDFVAQIQAVLDTSKAEAQLKDLEKNQKIKLDVDVNKSAQKEIDKTIEQRRIHHIKTDRRSRS